jgi:hypothetical protein
MLYYNQQGSIASSNSVLQTASSITSSQQNYKQPGSIASSQHITSSQQYYKQPAVLQAAC